MGNEYIIGNVVIESASDSESVGHESRFPDGELRRTTGHLRARTGNDRPPWRVISKSF